MMKELSHPWARLAIATALALGGLCGLSHLPAANGAPPPAAATQPGKPRSAEDIATDIDKVGQEIREAQPSMDALFDPAERAKAAPKALPVLRKMLPLMDELVAAEPRAREPMFRAKLELTSIMAMLGDEEALRSLRKLTFSDVRDESVSAKAWVMAVDWATAIKDPDAQQRILGDLTALGRKNTDNDALTQVASLMSEHASTPTLGEQAEDLIVKTLQGGMARELAPRIESRRKLRALEGKPMVIEGTTSDGKVFSTSDWKGKVILVDFWATWCPPCMAELPKVKKAYAEFHPKGLELIGVSSDHDPENFRAFLQDNKDMPWPQLLDPTAKEKHPLIDKFGIEGIPTMFLIDKRGICRTVTARENYEQMIPKLLEEKADGPATQPAGGK
jgi:thiol-disulfide isomerase/thioredoxin